MIQVLNLNRVCVFNVKLLEEYTLPFIRYDVRLIKL